MLVQGLLVLLESPFPGAPFRESGRAPVLPVALSFTEATALTADLAARPTVQAPLCKGFAGLTAFPVSKRYSVDQF